MKRASQFLFAALLVCSIFASEQTATGKKDQPAATGSEPQQQNQTPSPERITGAETPETVESFGVDVELLSATQGVAFDPYLNDVLSKIRDSWDQFIPQAARAPVMKSGTVSVEFQILKDGRVSQTKVAKSSGDQSLDRAALKAISVAAPFAALPQEYSAPFVRLRFDFYYNPGLVISPRGQVSVPAGSSRQFSVTVAGTKNTAVKWTVSGDGCQAEACGTMSEDGLYTAPSQPPNPPYVTISAVLKYGDPNKADSVKVAILPAQPAGPRNPKSR